MQLSGPLADDTEITLLMEYVSHSEWTHVENLFNITDLTSALKINARSELTKLNVNGPLHYSG